MTKRVEIGIKIIGVIVALVVLLFGDNIYQQITGHSVYEKVTPLFATETPSVSSPSPISAVALADNFDSSNSSYDRAIWECFNDCDSASILLKDGALSLLQRGNEGYTSLRSRSKWMYSDLISIKGKILISKNSSQGLGWLGIVDIVHCDINTGDNPQSPIIMCNSGRSADGTTAEYYTDAVSIQYDRWYQIEISFDHSSNTISFYVDNNRIGEHKPISPLGAGQIELATASDDATGIEVHMDDINVITLK